MKKTGVYVHIPFCSRKCVYCDFLSAPGSEEEITAYMRSLVKEIEQSSFQLSVKGEEVSSSKETEKRTDVFTEGSKQVDSVFIGGGTPSIVPAAYIEKTLETIKSVFFVAQDAEITIESNPGTLDLEKLRIYKKCGINRISIGLQSARDAELKLLGRIHGWNDFAKSFDMARAVGFDNINVDIMQALPGQTIERYRETLERVGAIEPEHVSAYSLILEEGTKLYECIDEYPPVPDEDTERKMYYMTREFFESRGYERYEISNFAKKTDDDRYRCRHNLGYWDRAPYIGFGLGASSFDGKCRYANTSDMKTYLGRKCTEEIRVNVETLSKKDAMAEFIFLGLRKTEGVDDKIFCEKFGQTIGDVYGEVTDSLIKKELLSVTKKGYALTDRGVDISNVVLAEFLDQSR